MTPAARAQRHNGASMLHQYFPSNKDEEKTSELNPPQATATTGSAVTTNPSSVAEEPDPPQATAPAQLAQANRSPIAEEPATDKDDNVVIFEEPQYIQHLNENGYQINNNLDIEGEADGLDDGIEAEDDNEATKVRPEKEGVQQDYNRALQNRLQYELSGDLPALTQGWMLEHLRQKPTPFIARKLKLPIAIIRSAFPGKPCCAPRSRVSHVALANDEQ
jgi:hypothetical protein